MIHKSGLFPRVKRPGSGDDHPPLSKAEVKERAELYLCTFRAGYRVDVTFNFYLFTVHKYNRDDTTPNNKWAQFVS
jgi:hypothetical protein